MQVSDWAQAFEQQLKPIWLLALAGDNQAYQQALTLMANRLRGYFAQRLTARHADVEDLVQETLMAVHLKRATYDDQYPVTAWVLGIGKYKLVDYWRRHARTDALTDDIELTDPNALIAPEPQQGSTHDIHVLLQTLPAGQRLAIELTKLKGLSIREAAQQTGMSESAMKVSVHRGLKRLARQMQSKA
jgi:RNA polymerase sigma factor (sigma-70 family)